MSTSTCEQFIKGLGDLEVRGVEHNFGWEPPGSLTTAQIPAKWVLVPRGTMATWTLEGGASTGILNQVIVVAVIPIAQGQYATNLIATVKMFDNLWHAIANCDLDTDEVAISKLWGNLAITAELEIDGTKHWAVVADVFGRGRIPNVLE